MNCNEFRTGLSAIVESREPCPDKWHRLREHAHLCRQTDCQQLWADEALLATVVPVWRSDVPPVSLAARVLSELRQAPGVDIQTQTPADVPTLAQRDMNSHPTIRRPSLASDRPARLWLALATSAASLLLIVSLFGTGGERPPVESVTAPSAQNLLVQQDDTPPETEGAAAVSKVVRTYAGVPQTATEFVTDTMVLFLPTDLSELNESDPHGAQPPSRPAVWRGRLGEQLEPWGRELGTAFDAIWEAVSDPPESSYFDSRGLSALSAAA